MSIEGNIRPSYTRVGSGTNLSNIIHNVQGCDGMPYKLDSVQATCTSMHSHIAMVVVLI